MTSVPATLSELRDALQCDRPELPVIFETAQGVLGAGYHLTELKHLRVSSIDCGGRMSDWEETLMQVLDSASGLPMSAAKMTAILERSVRALPGLADLPLALELAPRNQGLGRYHISGVGRSGAQIKISLTADGAACKPAVDLSCGCAPAQSSCCG